MKILKIWLSSSKSLSSVSLLRTKMRVARERLSKCTPKATKAASKKPTTSGVFNPPICETLQNFRPSADINEECGATSGKEESGALYKGFMEETGFARMTDIQRLMYARISTGKDVFGGAETGSGKTLAYLMPLVPLLNDRQRGTVLVCVPTRELVQQVLQVAKSLAHHGKFRARTFKQLQKFEVEDADLVIGLPREFRSFFYENEHCRIAAIVIDEADTLFLDADFSEDLRLLLDAFPAAQRIVVSATMPPALLKRLKTWIPGIHVLTTSGFLKPVNSVRQHFSDLKLPQAQKPARCMDLLLNDLPTQRNLVFCNSVRSAQRLYEEMLPEAKLRTALLHGRISPGQRGNLLKAFELGRVRNLVATDLLARGVDLKVDNVILYDFPHTLAEYLHRIGRTARAGKPGNVFALITSRDRPFFYKIKSMLQN